MVDDGCVRLAGDILRRWRCVGTALGFQTDSEIASFLLERSEVDAGKTTPQCVQCHGSLTLYCINCQLSAISALPVQTADTSFISPCAKTEKSTTDFSTLSSQRQCEKDEPTGFSSELLTSLGCTDETEKAVHLQDKAQEKFKLLSPTVPSIHPSGGHSGSKSWVKFHVFPQGENSGLDKEEFNKDMDHVDGTAHSNKNSPLVPDNVEHAASDHENVRSSDNDTTLGACDTEQTSELMSVLSIQSNLRKGLGRRQPDFKKRHHLFDRKSHVCEECNKSFALKSLLQKHRQSHAKVKSPYKSRKVNNTTSKVSLLKRNATMEQKSQALVALSPNKKPGSKKSKGNKVNTFSPAVHSSQLNGGCNAPSTQLQGRRSETKTKKSRSNSGHANNMKDRSVFCDECGAKSADPSSLKVHMRIHRDDRPYVCSDCGSGFRQASHLINHKRIHTDERPFKCSECEAAFRRAEELRTHMIKHTGQNPYVCTVCGMHSASASCLKVHMRIHNNEKRFVCNDCGAAFRQSGQLIGHRRRAHTGEKPYRCKHCDAAFATSGALKVHMVKHTGEKRFMCEECGAKFPYSSSLKVHMRTHTTDRPYVCSQCGASFNQPAILSRHLKTHSTDRPYMCTVCGSSFAHRPYLKDHMRFHTNERPYACTECDARFHMSCTLKTHMRTHSGEKPFVCSQCGSAFAESKNLRAHIKTHSGEKPHQCSQCGARFTVAGSLKIHMRKHTGEKPYVCSQCGMAYALSRDLKKHVQTHKKDGLSATDSPMATQHTAST